MIKYPRIKQFGIKVTTKPLDHIKHEDLRKALLRNGIARIFGQWFGVQTMLSEGPYAWDVEAVLERICSGRLKGSQLLMD